MTFLFFLPMNAAKAEIIDGDLTPLNSSQIKTDFSRAKFNRRTGDTSYDVTVTNTSEETFSSPIYISIEEITSPLVMVRNEFDTNAAGTPFFVIGSAFTGQLKPGDQLTSSIVFSNPSRVRFNFTANSYIAKTTSVTLFNNPGDLRLLRVETPAGDIIDYIGDKDDDGFATAVTSIQVQAVDGGESGFFLFDEQDRPIQLSLEDGATLKFNWQSDRSVIVTAISADGATQDEIPLDLPIQPTQLTLVEELTPSSDFRLANTQALTSPTGFINTVVSVSRCGKPVNNASKVKIIARNIGSGTINEFYGDGTQSQPGQYNVRLPFTFYEGGQDFRENFITASGFACAGTEVTFGTLVPALCKSVTIANPAYEILFSQLCKGTSKLITKKVTESCDALAHGIDRVLETFAEGPVSYLPSVSIPGRRELAESAIRALASDPPREFSIEDLPPPTAIPQGTYRGSANSSFAGVTKTAELTVTIDSNGLINHVFWAGGEVVTQNSRTIFGLYEMIRISEDKVTVEAFSLPPRELMGRIRSPGCTRHTLKYGNILQANITVELTNTNPVTLRIDAPDLSGTAR